MAARSQLAPLPSLPLVLCAHFAVWSMLVLVGLRAEAAGIRALWLPFLGLASCCAAAATTDELPPCLCVACRAVLCTQAAGSHTD